MIKKIFWIILLIPLTSFAQQNNDEDKSLVNWIDIETADSLFQINPKPMLIDVYTDWCGWCKHMMKTTYSNPNIAGYINTNFYPVRFNAEKPDTVTFMDSTFTMQGKVNKLALFLLDGRLAYPTTVFISYQKQKVAIPGYLSASEIEPFLVYFTENITYTDLKEFQTDFYFAFPNSHKEQVEKADKSLIPDTTGGFQWLTFEQALNLNRKEKKKYLVFLNVDWCYSCKVMKKIAFRNPVISDIIEKNFLPIDFNAASQDTIVINGQKFLPTGNQMPHQLASVLLQKKYIFPTLVILDENFKELTIIPYYFNAKSLEPVLQYYATDAWKNEDFPTFQKKFSSKIK